MFNYNHQIEYTQEAHLFIYASSPIRIVCDRIMNIDFPNIFDFEIFRETTLNFNHKRIQWLCFCSKYIIRMYRHSLHFMWEHLNANYFNILNWKSVTFSKSYGKKTSNFWLFGWTNEQKRKTSHVQMFFLKNWTLERISEFKTWTSNQISPIKWK